MLHHMLRAAAQRAFSTLDPYFKYVTMLLHGDGSALGSDTVTPFNSDASTNAFNVTINGDARSNNFNPYQAGYYSNSFDGSSFETVAGSTNLVFGTGDFTIECWVNFTSVSGGNFLDMRPTTTNGAYPNLYVSSGTLAYYVSSADRITGGTVAAGTWYHIALCRSGTSTKLFLNGTQVGSTYTDSNNYACGTNRPMIAGNGFSNSANFNGYISNFRFVKGTALYTTTFTPPTTPLTAISGTSLLICQSNRFIDNSASPYTITTSGSPQVAPAQPFTLPTSVATYGSGYFDGSGDYLSVASQTALGMGSGDFTYEAWIYVNEIVPTNALRGLYDSRVAGATGCGIYTSADVGTTSKLVYTTNSAIAASSTNTIKPYCWTHVAVTRSSGTVRGFLNGVLEFTVTDSRTFSSSAATYIATDISPQYFNGYINDARILKGTAQYTSAFTPPTAPLTAITNTSLLTTQYNGAGNNNGFKDSSQNNFVITRNGNTTQGTFSPYGANWSNYFDGSGDYLQAGTNANLALGSGNFTIEGWFFCTGYNGGAALYSTINTYPSSSGLLFYIDINGRYTIDVNGTILQPAGAASLNTWVHYAVVRSSNTITIYINGSSIGTVSSSTNYSDQYAVIGRTGAGSASNYFLGYISNTRMVKGTAVYTGSFTPSTTPLTAITNTALLLNYTNAGILDNAMMNDLETVGNAQISTSVKKYGTGSMYFDGSGDYLAVPSSPNLGFGSGDFTVEGWLYLNSYPGTSAAMYVCDFRNGSTNNFGFGVIGVSGFARPYMFVGSGPVDATGSTSLSLGVWYHIAMVRSGSTVTYYLNGVSDATMTTSYSQGATGVTIGARYTGSTEYVNGYIDDLRITKGVARYTSNFTAPTAAFPNN